jgi:hypothetical protein
MDATITYDEVAALVGVNIPTLEPSPNFERIRTLRRHLERALQCLPCPQSVQHGWKGMVMARELYSLLTNVRLRLPARVTGQPVDNTPLSRTEQASIDTVFNCRKHYFLSMQNIERACFTALDASINDAFKVSNDPNVRGWHAGMRVIDILDQLSSTYGQSTPSALEANDNIFRSPTLAADAPEVLFRRIKECAEKVLLGQNPYTDKHCRTCTPHHASHGGKGTRIHGTTSGHWRRLLLCATAPDAAAPPYLNLMKRFANWNACYSCGFDVAEGHTSQTCPQYLRKPDHDSYFT